MNAGFIPAVGTPLDENGNLMADSYKKQIEDQIAAGAVGILCMGSMGIEPYIRDAVYPEVAKAAVEAAAGRVPVYVGAMDTSVGRVKDRIASVEHLDVAGFVFTTPYYNVVTPDQMISFFQKVAALTSHSILLYDLAVVTQSKITYEVVMELLRTVPNLKGIKSADTQMFRKLSRTKEVPADFEMVYSGLDIFDVAYRWGINKCLDGMLSCTPRNTEKCFRAMKDNDYETAAECLDNIVSLRDVMAANGIWPSYTYVMNLLGYEGNFAPDYIPGLPDGADAKISEEMKRIGEL